MVLGQNKHAVGIFFSRFKAEQALGELKQTGFVIAKISIVAKVADRDAQLDAGLSDGAGDEASAEVATGAIAGGLLGAVLGCLAGLAIFWMPRVGFLAAVVPTGTALATTIAGAGIGAATGGLIERIAGLGMDSDRARVVRDRRGRGEFLVMVDGTEDEVQTAKSILSKSCSGQVWVC